MHDKKEKGDLGLTWAIAAITEQGWTVSLPISEHRKYDLIAEKNSVCKTVQVRYTTPKNGVLTVKLRSIWSDKNGVHYVKRQAQDFNILAVYNPQNRAVYFISSDKFNNGNSLALRVDHPKREQKGIRMAKDYLLFCSD